MNGDGGKRHQSSSSTSELICVFPYFMPQHRWHPWLEELCFCCPTALCPMPVKAKSQEHLEYISHKRPFKSWMDWLGFSGQMSWLYLDTSQEFISLLWKHMHTSFLFNLYNTCNLSQNRHKCNLKLVGGRIEPQGRISSLISFSFSPSDMQIQYTHSSLCGYCVVRQVFAYLLMTLSPHLLIGA